MVTPSACIPSSPHGHATSLPQTHALRSFPQARVAADAGVHAPFAAPLCAAALAGLVASLVRVPTEVVKSRLQTREFVSAHAALRAILAKEGVKVGSRERSRRSEDGRDRSVGSVLGGNALLVPCASLPGRAPATRCLLDILPSRSLSALAPFSHTNADLAYVLPSQCLSALALFPHTNAHLPTRRETWVSPKLLSFPALSPLLHLALGYHRATNDTACASSLHTLTLTVNTGIAPAAVSVATARANADGIAVAATVAVAVIVTSAMILT
eukprot:363570-Chlamydomonas_euryale.AAC.7